ncbi:phage tail protein [Hymenobacter sediminicola]|uniref:Phage tail protein n=1 Tax=Hymenobacter sediminicola TaxID=2761579 RepID=A0A7G7W9N6_9BACT|nr:tail fiber protein [Hymenobacter sediminicola]QNH63079.1 phage tail protein [Hymenobacter sediminicola]
MDEPYIGEIRSIAFGYAPKNWAFCNGQLLPVNQYQALFSLLGTTYGGNGSTTFGLPNLQSRVAVGAGQGPGLQNYVLGQQAGNETVSLTPDQMPAHGHTITGTMQAGASADENGPIGNFPGGDASNHYSAGPKNATLGTANAVKGQTDAQGANQPHDNRQPYLATHFVIALQGIFPSRS